MPETKKRAKTPQRNAPRPGKSRGYEAAAPNQMDGLRVAAVEGDRTASDQGKQTVIEKLIDFLKAMD